MDVVILSQDNVLEIATAIAGHCRRSVLSLLSSSLLSSPLYSSPLPAPHLRQPAAVARLGGQAREPATHTHARMHTQTHTNTHTHMHTHRQTLGRAESFRRKGFKAPSDARKQCMCVCLAACHPVCVPVWQPASQGWRGKWRLAAGLQGGTPLHSNAPRER